MNLEKATEACQAILQQLCVFQGAIFHQSSRLNAFGAEQG